MDFEQEDISRNATNANVGACNARFQSIEFVPNKNIASPRESLDLLPLHTISPRSRRPNFPEDVNPSLLANPSDSRSSFTTNVQQFDSSKCYLGNVFRGMPVWLLSLIFHLIVLLSLAWFTLGNEVRRGRIVLEVDEATNAFVINTTDIFLDRVELDQPGELELSDFPAMEFDSPDLSSALSESVTLPSEDRIDLSSLDDLEVGYGSKVDGTLAEVGDSSKAKFFGISSYGKKFVFVIDCSGSMKGSRWRRAVSELRQAISGLDEQQEFLVLLYNTQTKVMLDANIQSAGMAVATSDNKRRMFYWLKKQIPNGSTFPGPAIYAALKLRPDAIFLLSDGLLKDNTVNWLKEWNAPVSAQGEYDASRMVRMNTISLDVQGEWVMRTIANQNGGVFVSAR